MLQRVLSQEATVVTCGRSLCDFMVGIRAKSFEKALVEVEVVHVHLTGQEVEGAMKERSTAHAD